MLLRVACILVLCGILVTGLWPFHAPRNNASWLPQGTGLHIGKYGSIVTVGEFTIRRPERNDSCSLEIWLAPGRASASGSILAFYRPETHSSPFALRQSLSDLSIESRQNGSKTKIYVDDFFSRPNLVLLTLSSNPSGTVVYADGAFVKAVPNFRFSPQDLTGRLILGNSPFSTHEWSGDVKGLAIYGRALMPEEVLQHYKQWTADAPSVLSENLVAVYRFDEGAGNLIHNRVDPATDLTIPSRFFILDEQFLERPWKEFRNDRRYWEDVGINVAGFIPLGLVFFAFFSTASKFKNAALPTVAIGFAASLTIEVGQAFLPTRNSGMTDLITNTLGTALGVLLFRVDFVKKMFALVGLTPSSPKISNITESSLEFVATGPSDSAK
jgi:VanZ like family/Concanavalin A-like lectin/glucanases superfamily